MVPTLVGGLIYVGYRSTDLLLFDWADVLGLEHLVHVIRLAAAAVYLPPFATQSLPAGLWSFGLSALIGVVWSEESSTSAGVWHLMPFCLGVGSELLQAIEVLPGTYDTVDLLAYSVGSSLGYFTVRLITSNFEHH